MDSMEKGALTFRNRETTTTVLCVFGENFSPWIILWWATASQLRNGKDCARVRVKKPHGPTWKCVEMCRVGVCILELDKSAASIPSISDAFDAR